MSEQSQAENRSANGRTNSTEQPENVLRPVRKRPSAAPVPSQVQDAPAAKKSPVRAAKSDDVPEEVKKRFVQIRRAYHFPDGARAFTDRGSRLTSPSENTEVIRSLVDIAQARGWEKVVVTGTERFRREAWAAGTAAGLKVQGYRPTEFEQSRLVRSLAGRGGDGASAEVPSTTERAPRQRDRNDQSRVLSGKLVDHGRANYKHDMKEPMSYFVKIETGRGDRTIWGVDLERALRQSLSQPKTGDEIGLRSIRRDQVTVKTPRLDGEGKVVGTHELPTHRNLWIVEKREFLEERSQAASVLRDTSIDPRKGARKHPELAGTYLQVAAAKLAAQQLRDPQDRTQFVARVREALATSVERGEPLAPVRLKTRRSAAATRTERTQEHTHARA
jgi:putative DNA primase/helicase